MSIDLHVDVNFEGSIELPVLRQSVATSLRELLDLATVPDLVIDELNAGVRTPVAPDAVLGPECAWLLRLDMHPEYAYLAKVEVDDLSTPRGLRRFAHVMAGGYRTPLEFALTAAVAISVARRYGSSISDGARFFTPDVESDVEEFVQRLRVKGPFDDSFDAAELFERNLFHSGFNPG